MSAAAGLPLGLQLEKRALHELREIRAAA